MSSRRSAVCRPRFCCYIRLGGRVFFVIPWLGKTLLGTTDTECTESPDRVHVTEADVAYLLEGHNHFFDPQLRESGICSALSWA